MNSKQAEKLALELPDVTVKPHFDREAFSANKRIFMTIWHDENQANLRFDLTQQKKFLSIDGESFTEIDNGWGRQGWTTVHFNLVELKDFKLALQEAYNLSSSKSVKNAPAKKLTKKAVGKKKSK